MHKYIKVREIKLRRLFTQLKIDALLVKKPENISYLSGFRGADSYLLVTKHSKYILSDSRYEAELKENCSDSKIRIFSRNNSFFMTLAKILKQAGIASLGYEGNVISHLFCVNLKKHLSSFKLHSTRDVIESLRVIKDESEIIKIKKSIKIAEDSLSDIFERMLSKPYTEKEFAAELEFSMKLRGAEDVAFKSIVASSKNSQYPHAVATDKKINKKNILLIDWGAKYSAYCSDLTRTFFLGKITAQFKDIYLLVKEAQQIAFENIKEGVLIGSVDRKVRNFFKKHKVSKCFSHALGHGLGLEIHEMPSIINTSENTFRKNMIVTVEPGLYLEGWGGVRLEDMVCVTENGCECLSVYPKYY